MLSSKYNTVLVARASSGIGQAVKLLCKKGYRVTALARRKLKQ